MARRSFGPPLCAGTNGAAFHSDLRVDADLIIRKGFRPEIDSYSAFFENDHETPTGLAGYLRERGCRQFGDGRPCNRFLRPLLSRRRRQTGV